MARSSETFGKKEKEKRKQQKKKEKAMRREERKANSEGGGLDNMMAYVDEFGNISSTPPDPTKKKVEIKAENIDIDYLTDLIYKAKLDKYYNISDITTYLLSDDMYNKRLFLDMR